MVRDVVIADHQTGHAPEALEDDADLFVGDLGNLAQVVDLAVADDDRPGLLGADLGRRRRPDREVSDLGHAASASASRFRQRP